jgi:F0F1-type ATP synthase assembly protein I
MGKVSTKPKASRHASSQDEIAKLAASATAKQQFVNSTLDMGWRLTLSILVPVIIGSWLDNRYHTSPSWTLAALFIAVVLSVGVVTNTVKSLNNNQGRKSQK